jgi:DNA-binding response OmpR family regulator
MPDASNFSDSQAIIITKTDLIVLARTIVDQILAEQAPEPTAEAPTIIQTGPIRVDLLAYEASVDGEPMALKTREFELLATLARNVGHVMSRASLIQLAWPHPEDLDDERTVDVHILRIRKKLGGAGKLIETVHSVGYKLRGERVLNRR